MVANVITEGRSGDVDLSGVTAVAIFDWPKAIHDGNGRAVFVVTPETTDEQIGELANIYTGAYGGLPWEILGTTFQVAGLVKAPITIEAEGLRATVRVEGVGEASGHHLENPVTGERHEAHIVLPDGFIWTKGECGVGSYRAAAEGLDLSFQDTNWILYDFDWSNAWYCHGAPLGTPGPWIPRAPRRATTTARRRALPHCPMTLACPVSRTPSRAGARSSAAPHPPSVRTPRRPAERAHPHGDAGSLL